MTGRLFGVGVGPGDPELVTLKAQRILSSCPVLACFAARGRPGNAWTTIAGIVRPDQVVLRLEYPLTVTRKSDDDYERQLADFYDVASRKIAALLDHDDDVAVACEGDPFFYGSYMHLHHRLASRYVVTVVPGVTSFSAASAAAGTPLVSQREALTVIPATLPMPELVAALAGADAAVVMKVGRRLDDVRAALVATGRLGEARYVERASCLDERVLPMNDTGGVEAPYFSVVLVPGRALAARTAPA
jgi:precorrin-2/cobalt-factor-2 C20-methyltransferase